MTEEELKKEAEDYARKWLFYVKDLELHRKEDDKPKYIRIKEAYLAGAEPREKQIAELETQIEKMKLCQICKHYQWESCSYHSLWEKDCKANNHKLFELVGDKRK